MTGAAPYVVVLAASDRKVGRSTLAANLATYLKGLDEDLPVGLVSFDPGYDPAGTFALGGQAARAVDFLLDGERLEAQLCLGQFGVEYLAGGTVPALEAAALRGLLRASDFPGVLVIDAGPLDAPAAAAALQTADLVLAPLREAAGLAALARVRREIRTGGGSDAMLWLVPAMVENPQAQQQQLQLLRFAAAERGCQVLTGEFPHDGELPQRTCGAGGTVLTRMPHSSAHGLLKRLAELVLDCRGKGRDVACHLRRLRQDRVLPARFRRVEPVCPLCAGLALDGEVHYGEALPQRKRWLVHRDCFAALLRERRVAPFWNGAQTAVMRTGVEGRGLLPQLQLLVADPRNTFVEGEHFVPLPSGDWPALVRHATGRLPAEQLPGLLFVYPAVAAARVLEKDWYRHCAALRRGLRRTLIAGL